MIVQGVDHDHGVVPVPERGHDHVVDQGHGIGHVGRPLVVVAKCRALQLSAWVSRAPSKATARADFVESSDVIVGVIVIVIVIVDVSGP